MILHSWLSDQEPISLSLSFTSKTYYIIYINFKLKEMTDELVDYSST